jgi:hypothetical protein
MAPLVVALAQKNRGKTIAFMCRRAHSELPSRFNPVTKGANP